MLEWMHVTFILMLIFSGVQPARLAEPYCEKSCIQTDKTVACENCIPKTVASTVEEIVLSKFNESRLVPQMFCNVLWENVTKLAIKSDRVTSKFYYFTLPDKTFYCLHKIESLQFSISSLNDLSSDAFYGLTNVRNLDLTACNHLTTSKLTVGLSSAETLPTLSAIILTNLGSYYDGIEITQEFLDVLARRNISTIDFSYSKVKLTSADLNLGQLCETLKTLDLAHSEIERSPFVLDHNVCASLQTVNISGMIFPGTPSYLNGSFPISGLHYTGTLHGLNFFSKSQVLIANTVIPEYVHIYIRNSVFNITFENSITEVHLSGYSIPVIDAEFHFYPNYLKHLDISNNKIETLNQTVISYMEHLEKVDLSKNKLEVISNTLFRSYHKLKDICLAYNRITYLPLDIFEYNINLKNINLSGNQIKEITFSFEHLLSLEVVDLQENSIEFLDEWSRNQIDRLYDDNHNNTQRTHTNETLAIDLRDNPLSCQCPSGEFINWFVNSPVFYNSRNLYHCTIDGYEIPMDRKATQAAEDDCERPEREKRKLLLSVLLPTFSIGLLVLLLFKLFKTYRRRKMQRRMEDQIELLQEGSHEFRFPVFLSFSSEDTEFVLPNIHQPLQASYI